MDLELALGDVADKAKERKVEAPAPAREQEAQEAPPVVAGTALGLWIDARWPGGTSWTLVLMLAGVALGCANAWYWIQREGRRDD